MDMALAKACHRTDDKFLLILLRVFCNHAAMEMPQKRPHRKIVQILHTRRVNGPPFGPVALFRRDYTGLHNPHLRHGKDNLERWTLKPISGYKSMNP